MKLCSWKEECLRCAANACKPYQCCCCRCCAAEQQQSRRKQGNGSPRATPAAAAAHGTNTGQQLRGLWKGGPPPIKRNASHQRISCCCCSRSRCCWCCSASSSSWCCSERGKDQLLPSAGCCCCELPVQPRCRDVVYKKRYFFCTIYNNSFLFNYYDIIYLFNILSLFSCCPCKRRGAPHGTEDRGTFSGRGGPWRAPKTRSLWCSAPVRS